LKAIFTPKPSNYLARVQHFLYGARGTFAPHKASFKC